jgi:3-phenylpropionate/trans-cinnamate dioxygenase ferredoxin reductase subunit
MIAIVGTGAAGTAAAEALREHGYDGDIRLYGAGEPYRDIPWMWSDQHDLLIQMTGFGFDGAQVVRRGDVRERQGVLYVGVRDGRVTGACGMSIGTGIARPLRAAQILIENDVEVDVTELADPGLDLRRLARGVPAAP